MNSAQRTVLVVDDDSQILGLVIKMLRPQGVTVLSANRPSEAWRICEAQPIHILISDVVMPEMDGPTLLKELRRRNPNVKVIFVSGYAEEAFSKNLPDREQYEFLAKPFTLKQLVSKVKETLPA